MEYTMVVNWNRGSNALSIDEGSVLYKNSVSVNKISVNINPILPVGWLVDATFGLRVGNTTTALTTALPMRYKSAGVYDIGVPDKILATSGNFAVAFTIKEPVPVSGVTKYKVVTTGEVYFAVDATTAALVQSPVVATAADVLQTQLGEVAADLAELSEKVGTRWLADFSVNPQTGEGVKVYNDGTSATFMYSLGNLGANRTNYMTVLTFADSSFVNGEVAFPAAMTGMTNKDFIAELTETDVDGERVRADSIFKGSDGSILVSAGTPYSGRVLVIGGLAEGVGITNIAKVTTVGVADYYRISMSNNTYKEIQLVNGRDGQVSALTVVSGFSDGQFLYNNNGVVGGRSVDSGPVENSNNLISSGGVFDAVRKAKKITFDAVNFSAQFDGTCTCDFLSSAVGLGVNVNHVEVQKLVGDTYVNCFATYTVYTNGAVRVITDQPFVGRIVVS